MNFLTGLLTDWSEEKGDIWVHIKFFFLLENVFILQRICLQGLSLCAIDFEEEISLEIVPRFLESYVAKVGGKKFTLQQIIFFTDDDFGIC